MSNADISSSATAGNAFISTLELNEMHVTADLLYIEFCAFFPLRYQSSSRTPGTDPQCAPRSSKPLI